MSLQTRRKKAVQVLKDHLAEDKYTRILEVLDVGAQDAPRVADVSWGDLLEVDDKYLALFSGSKCKSPAQNVHKTGKSLRHRPVPRP
jgi:ATP-dependent protease HslVU (ClpYQ) peptidase subunit